MNGKQNQQPNNQQVAQQALRQKIIAEKKRKMLIRKILIIVSAVIALIIVFAVYQFKIVDNGIKKDQFQAVFMTNGQVYFGKLKNPNSDYMTLENVYYLQVQEKQEQAENQNQQVEGGEPQLIKLGEELHGPEDKMKISKAQVTFWENLKEDSKVVKAIKQYSQK